MGLLPPQAHWSPVHEGGENRSGEPDTDGCKYNKNSPLEDDCSETTQLYSRILEIYTILGTWRQTLIWINWYTLLES